MRTRRADALQRSLAVLSIGLLAAGFLYSGAATFRLYRELFSRPAAAGRNISIDRNLAVVNLSSGEQLRAAVDRAHWPQDEDVVVVDAGSTLSHSELTQFYYSASYLLYPRRVWLSHAPHQPRYVLLVGRSNPFDHSSCHPLSDLLTLVNLP
jgi:hypothetical protein